MPHIWVEYSANLAPQVDIPALLKEVQNAAIGDGSVFPYAGARTRGVKVDDYLIVDGHPDNAFVHVLFRIAPGRSSQDKQQAGQNIFDALKRTLAPITASRPLGISVQIQEADEAFNYKTSNYREYLEKRRVSIDRKD